ncbi:MAG TPA: bifunctional diaminohydroxyphosphoribosylaminopyrimidine deaminase/5-amino-6-(5-phosphoribosylamino)uracil reductase RibD [Polyangiaceae bacterium]|nr:bifunctional diaminohydroxyphosphoribosylaminopyrimidine deaminase/5-amino-6-(5-phosphoribosylamino)uracil reductase RibD [Polyangiaceae bacterium]
MTAVDHEAWMTLAIGEGRSGRPSPNPHVGALVVKDGKILARAHHARAGGEHAELAALRLAGSEARGATVYVSLEPCNHHGKTPPCTDALIAAGVACVVVGVLDPNPHVRGGGVDALQKAGIQVVTGVSQAAAHALAAPWLKHITLGLPYVSLKLALTLDGRIATRSGASKWVTGPEARAKVHALRSSHDAVAVGVGTVVADDPRLTVRDSPGTSPVRVVFDTTLRLPLDGQLVASAREIPLVVLCSLDASPKAEAELQSHGAVVLRAPESTAGRVDIESALRLLGERGIVSMMVEGGAELAGSFLAGRLADELHAFIAPSLFGPRGRPGAVDWKGPATPTEAPRITRPVWECCGDDAYVHGPVAYPDEE